MLNWTTQHATIVQLLGFKKQKYIYIKLSIKIGPALAGPPPGMWCSVMTYKEIWHVCGIGFWELIVRTEAYNSSGRFTFDCGPIFYQGCLAAYRH